MIKRTLLLMALSALSIAASATAAPGGRVTQTAAVPILLYHRFGHTVPDSMTVTDDTFAWQLSYLREHHYVVIRLHALVDFLQGKGPAPPPRAVVITADDGHRSVYTDMLPLVRSYGMPVTLFIYPSAISNATYAMTWPELGALIRTGLFEVQSHTYWHPNFNHERARLTPHQFDAFVRVQLTRSRQVLESRLGVSVDLLAWPFGIYDADLMGRARAAGYVAAFTIERRPVTARDPLMGLPRYIVTNADRGAAFAALVGFPHSRF